MNVFVSFSGKDREIKNRIVEALRSGLDPDTEIYDSDKRCASDFSAECIQAIRMSQVFIVLLSASSMANSSYVINEVVEARNREMEGELDLVIFKLDDAPMTERFTMQLNHISDANHTGRIYRNTEIGIRSLVSKVQILLQRRKNGQPEKPFDVFKPAIRSLSLGGAGYFVDHSRDRVFRELDEAFSRSNVIFAAQFGGYGRRSAVRKYVELHAGEYKDVLFFPMFSGTVFDFFLTGLSITNINEGHFEGLSDREVILRKVALLNKLDPETLLVVPDVSLPEMDEQFLCDVLSSLKCRIIFVVESVPRRYRERLTVVYVNRMENEYLLNLFFHHYGLAGEEARASLREPLLAFFDSVDGHTKTVQMAATTLADEYIYPEDLPQVLRKISPDAGDALSSQIFESASELFEMRRFEPAARRILLCAALVAEKPIDEKTFVELLHACGCFDGKQLRMLTELRWLDSDPTARLISLDPLLCKVCLAKIPMESQMLDECLIKLNDSLDKALMSSRLPDIREVIQRIHRLWTILHMDECARATGLYLRFLDTNDPTQAVAGLPGFKEAVLKECAQLPERCRKECEECLWEHVFLGLSLRTDLNTRCFIDAETPLGEALCDAFFSKSLSMLKDNLELPGEVSAMMENMPELASLDQLVSLYLSLIRTISRSDHLEEWEDQDTFYFWMENIGTILDTFLSNNPYIRLKICRARIQLTETMDGYFFESNHLRLWCSLTDCLLDLGEYGEELEDAFANVLHFFEQEWNAIYATRAEADSELFLLMKRYLYGMLSARRTGEAEEVCRRMLALSLEEQEIFCSVTGCVNAVAEAYLGQGYTEEALNFLEDAIRRLEEVLTENFRESEELRDALDVLGSMKETDSILRDPSVATDFFDASEAYASYYDVFAAAPADKRRMNRYSAIAREAARQDFSALSQEAIQARLRALAGRARDGDAWEALAPEAFALVSEAGFRTLGYRHHYVQYLGASAIYDGCVAEMQNGEGKTYTIVLSAVLHSLYGRKTHILDSSEYLCRRNFIWMRGLLEYLGLSVGVQMSSSDRDIPSIADCDILYTTIRSAPFLAIYRELGVPSARKLHLDAAIVDEADETMIAQAGPIVLKGAEIGDDKPLYELAARVLSRIKPDSTRYYLKKGDSITLRPAIFELAERELGQDLSRLSAPQRFTLESALKVGVRVLFHYEKDKDYFIRPGADGSPSVMVEDAKNGSFFPIRDSYAYFVWLRENLPEQAKRLRLVRRSVLSEWDVISFLKSYRLLGGVSATASSMKQEFQKIYGLPVFPVPTNAPVARRDHPPIIYATKEIKEAAIAELVAEKHEAGQPVLLITGSVSESQHMAQVLRKRGIRAVLINAANAEADPDRLSYAGEPGVVTVTTAMANRGVDICLGGSPSVYAKNTLLRAGVDPAALDKAISGMDAGEDAALRRRYTDLCALNWHRISGEKAKLEALGGLCVIGTTCFDDLRVEQQMRGRCGRQGSPGESYVFYSLEDASLKQLLQDRLQQMIRLLDVTEDNLNTPILNRAISSARHKLQAGRYSDLTETPSVLYYQDARRVILGRIPELQREDFDLKAFAEKLFDADPRYRKDLSVLRRENGQALPPASLIGKLSDRISGKKLPLLPYQIPRFLAELFCDAVTIPPAVIPMILRDHTVAAWREYLLQMGQEIAETEHALSETARQKSHLSSYSKSLSQSLYRDFMEKALSAILTARVRESR